MWSRPVLLQGPGPIPSAFWRRLRSCPDPAAPNPRLARKRHFPSRLRPSSHPPAKTRPASVMGFCHTGGTSALQPAQALASGAGVDGFASSILVLDRGRRPNDALLSISSPALVALPGPNRRPPVAHRGSAHPPAVGRVVVHEAARVYHVLAFEAVSLKVLGGWRPEGPFPLSTLLFSSLLF